MATDDVDDARARGLWEQEKSTAATIDQKHERDELWLNIIVKDFTIGETEVAHQKRLSMSAQKPTKIKDENHIMEMRQRMDDNHVTMADLLFKNVGGGEDLVDSVGRNRTLGLCRDASSSVGAFSAAAAG